MPSSPPRYSFRSKGPVLKIEKINHAYWRLFVGEFGGDYFEDEREAAEAAAGKLSGFTEWDESPYACPSDIDSWERV